MDLRPDTSPELNLSMFTVYEALDGGLSLGIVTRCRALHFAGLRLDQPDVGHFHFQHFQLQPPAAHGESLSTLRGS